MRCRKLLIIQYLVLNLLVYFYIKKVSRWKVFIKF
nr:MAG TPA: hypothetical protein [Caudoviricetes sp.]